MQIKLPTFSNCSQSSAHATSVEQATPVAFSRNYSQIVFIKNPEKL